MNKKISFVACFITVACVALPYITHNVFAAANFNAKKDVYHTQVNVDLPIDLLANDILLHPLDTRVTSIFENVLTYAPGTTQTINVVDGDITIVYDAVANPTFGFRSAFNHSGVAVFQYTIEDMKNNNTDSNFAYIYIKPLANNDNWEISNMNTALPAQILADDIGTNLYLYIIGGHEVPEVGTLSFTVYDPSGNGNPIGTMTAQRDGNITFTLTAEYVGPINILYTTNDNVWVSDSAKVKIVTSNLGGPI